MAVFMLFTTLIEPKAKGAFVAAYSVKILLTTVALFLCRKTFGDIKPDWRMVPIGVIVGLLTLVEWLVVDAHTPPLAFLGTRIAFNPNTEIAAAEPRMVFLAMRFFGLAIVVPVMEELFWRSFLMRYVADPDYHKLPVGTVTPMALGIVSLVFGFSHTEWLAAILCGIIYGVLLRQTKSLFAVIIAHATTNAALGIYVLMSQQWKYW